MSLHLAAKKGDIAPAVLLPGDPLRAKFIAEKYLEKFVNYNNIRGMLGYTGTYKRKRISVQGTGIGVPSSALYIHELICDYGATKLIRTGTCGAVQKNIGMKDIVLAMSACTDSGFNRLRFSNMDYAPTASFALLNKAYTHALHNRIKVDVGSVLSSDIFYHEDGDEDPYKIWRDYGVLVVEMETAGLYTLAARYQVDALSILTVSDNLATGERATHQERESAFMQMVEMALEVI